MPNVEFKVGNQRFDLVCDEGQQSQIKALAHSLDARVTELSRNLGSAPDGLLLVVTALMMEDELQNIQSQQKQGNRREIALNMLTQDEVIRMIDDMVSPVVEHIDALAQKVESM